MSDDSQPYTATAASFRQELLPGEPQGNLADWEILSLQGANVHNAADLLRPGN